MCASMVSLSIPVVLNLGGAEVVVQEIFDSIITGLLPLCLTFVLYYLIRKGVKTTTLLWGIIIVSILGSVLGIL